MQPIVHMHFCNSRPISRPQFGRPAAIESRSISCAPSSALRRISTLSAQFQPQPTGAEARTSHETDTTASKVEGAEVLYRARKIVLDHVEDALSNFCRSIDSPERSADCMDVVRYLRNKREEGEQACEVEIQATGKPARSCQTLDDLERMIWELEYAGGIDNMYRVLAIQKRLEARSKLAQESENTVESEAWTAQTLFNEIDKDKDGYLSKDEFFEGLSMLHQHLLQSEVKTIRKCVDIQGRIPRDEFMDIAYNRRPAEAILKHTITQLFHSIDKDGDGGLDRREFLSALNVLQDKLDSYQMELLIRCLDMQGRVPAAQFLDILQSRQPGEVMLRQVARQLFDANDRDGNGLLDREEFLNAMSSMREVLDTDKIETIFSAMDIHGFVSRDQFLDIVSAESLSDPHSDASLFRHITHSRPSWWSECPASVDTA